MSIGGIRTRFRLYGLGVACAGLCMIGCGGSDEMPTAKVAGKVTFKGEPVTGGDLIFSPVADPKKKFPGKSGRAAIKSDGTYTVSTYGEGDGAVVGQCRIMFSAPPAPAAAHSENSTGTETAEPPKYSGLVTREPTYEVKSGTNTIDVDLISANGN